MKGKLIVIYAIIDVTIMALLVIGYRLGVQVGQNYLFINNSFTQIYAGVLGVTIVLAFTKFLRSTIFLFFKSISLFMIAHSECTNMHEAIKCIFKKFDKTLEILVFVKLISECIEELKELVMDYISSTEKCNAIAGLMSELENTNIGFFTKVGSKYLAKSLQYIDECILVYCYSQEDVNIFEAAKNSFNVFFKSFGSIIERVLSISFLQVLIKVLIFCIYAVLFVHYFSLNVYYFVITFLIYRGITFIIEDAVMEPLMMISITKDFIKKSTEINVNDPSMSDEIINQVVAGSTSLQKLFSMKNASVSDLFYKNKKQSGNSLEHTEIEHDSQGYKEENNSETEFTETNSR